MNATLQSGLSLLILAGFALPSGLRSQDLQTLSVSGGRAAAAINGTDERNKNELLPLATTGAHHLLPGALPVSRQPASLPRVFAPTQPRDVYTRFPWKRNIVSTVFWIGETPTAKNPTPNTMSAWDRRWTSNYGGFDNPSPSARDGYLPKAFTPEQNPFYFALPYNDINRSGTKASARAAVPWFKKTFYRNGRTVLKGRWMAIRCGDRVCYAQWEDVGPFQTDDWEYVFGDSRPKTTKNKGVGLDVSPAVRDYLEFEGGYGTVDWRFVDVDEVPDGPWRKWGSNNPFADPGLTENGDSPESDDAEERGSRKGLLAARDEDDEKVQSIE